MLVSWLAFCNSRRKEDPSAEKTFLLKASRAKGQPPQAVAAAQGRLRRRRSSPMRPGIAFVAAPGIRPRGARNATHTLFQQPRTRAERLRRAAERRGDAERDGLPESS